MEESEIGGRRLADQLLVKNKMESPAEIVRHLGVVQAQDYSGGEWSIGLRLPGSRLSHIDKAISERKIIRTWALRCTLHFVASTDARWILELLAPQIIAGLARRYKELNLDNATLRKTNSIIENAVKEETPRTRDELKTILERKGVSCEGQRAVFILNRAALDKIICFGPMRERQQTFVLFDEWVPETESWTKEKSLGELTKRYFTSHGPATLQDYMWWSGLSASDAKAGIEIAKRNFVNKEIDGKVHWMKEEIRQVNLPAPLVRLLPPFDEFLLGYKNRRASIDIAVAKKLRTGGMPDSTIMVDGKIAGTWRRTFRKEVVSIETRKFRKLTKSEQKELEAAAERYAVFVGKRLDLRR